MSDHTPTQKPVAKVCLTDVKRHPTSVSVVCRDVPLFVSPLGSNMGRLLSVFSCYCNTINPFSAGERGHMTFFFLRIVTSRTIQDLSNIGDVSVTTGPFTPYPIANVSVMVARDASYAIVSSTQDLRNFVSPGMIVRIGGIEASGGGTLMGTNGEGYLDYPGGVGHR